MSHFLCRAVVARSQVEQPGTKTEMQLEQDFIDARVAELAREARRQRVARLIAQVTSVWTPIVDRLTRPSREAQQRKDLLERLDTMPAYMLNDIGVFQDTVGRYCYHDDFGKQTEVVPVLKKPASPRRAQFSAAAAGRMVLHPAE
jgi:hypothetical protein